jgi:hypothetical protein
MAREHFIYADVVEVARDETTKGRGRFEFLQLPAPNDRMTISNGRGGIDILRVIYVEHHPVEIPTPLNAREDATATVLVEWVEVED